MLSLQWSARLRHFFLWMLCIFCVLGWHLPVLAETVPAQTTRNIQILPNSQYSLPMKLESMTDAAGKLVQVSIPDFAQISAKNLPLQVTPEIVQQLQTFSGLTDLSLQQAIGQFVPMADILPIGFFGVEQMMSFSSVSQLAGIDLGSISLGDIPDFTKNLPIDNFVSGLNIPGLRISEALPIAELAVIQNLTGGLAGGLTGGLSQALANVPGGSALTGLLSGGTPDVQTLIGLLPANLGLTADSTIGQFLQAIPGLGSMKLDTLGVDALKNFGLESLPGLSSVPFSAIADAGKVVNFSSVPGLSSIPLKDLPAGLGLISDGVAPFVWDVVLASNNESKQPSFPSAVGTLPDSSWKFKKVGCGDKCNFVEANRVGSKEHQGMSLFIGLKGSDCFGPMCAVFGNEGCAGTHPFGKAARICLENPSEKQGTVDAAIYLRGCATFPFIGLSCTSYGLKVGSFPIKEGTIFPITIPEEGTVVAGEIPGPPPGYRADGSQGDSCTDLGSISGSLDGRDLKDVTKAILGTNAQWDGNAGGKCIPAIINECQKVGLTDTASIAYALATVQHESDGCKVMQEYKCRNQYDSCGCGQGYIQVTWCDGKSKALKLAGRSYIGSGNDPQLDDPAVAARVACQAFKTNRIFGNQKTLAECGFSGGKTGNLQCARGIINADYNLVVPGASQTTGSKVDGYYTKIVKAIEGVKPADSSTEPEAGAATAQPAPPSSDSCSGGSTTPVPCPPGQTCALLNPLPNMSNAGIYSRFRRRRPNHNGVDIQSAESPGNYDAGLPNGGPVVAPDDGVVVYAANDGSGYANIVKIYHPQRGISTFHAHLSKILVKQGDKVKRGQQIAVEGGNGINGPRSYGIHLHFEIHPGPATPGDPYGNRADPENYNYEKRTIPKPGADMFG